MAPPAPTHTGSPGRRFADVRQDEAWQRCKRIINRLNTMASATVAEFIRQPPSCPDALEILEHRPDLLVMRAYEQAWRDLFAAGHLTDTRLH